MTDTSNLDAAITAHNELHDSLSSKPNFRTIALGGSRAAGYVIRVCLATDDTTGVPPHKDGFPVEVSVSPPGRVIAFEVK